MNKRSVMAPLNPKPPPEEVKAEEQKDLEDDIFDLPKNDAVADVAEKLDAVRIEEHPDKNPPAPKPKAESQTQKSAPSGRKRDYSHLTKAREKSLETRRRKKQEKEKLDTDAQAYKERMEYERLCEKFNKQPVPKVVSKPVADQGRSQASAEPPPPVEQPVESYQHKGSANSEAYTGQSVIDYDRIVNGVTNSLTKNELYFKELETKIREDERKKSAEQMKLWQQDQHRKQRSQQAYGILSGNSRRNQVFDRTSALRNSYTARYKNNWY